MCYFKLGKYKVVFYSVFYRGPPSLRSPPPQSFTLVECGRGVRRGGWVTEEVDRKERVLGERLGGVTGEVTNGEFGKFPGSDSGPRPQSVPGGTGLSKDGTGPAKG